MVILMLVLEIFVGEKCKKCGIDCFVLDFFEVNV